MTLWFRKQSLPVRHNACQISIEHIEMKFRFYFLPPNSFPPLLFLWCQEWCVLGFECLSEETFLSLRRTPDKCEALLFWKEHDGDHLFFSYSLCSACQCWLLAACCFWPSLTSSYWPASHLPLHGILYCLCSTQPMLALTREQQSMLCCCWGFFAQHFESNLTCSSSVHSGTFLCVVM